MKISVGYYLSSVHLLKDNITCAAKRKEQKEKVGKQYIVTAKLILILSLCHAKGQAPRNRFRHPLHLLFNSFRCNRSFKRERERGSIKPNLPVSSFGCRSMSDPPKVPHFWRIRQGFRESKQRGNRSHVSLKLTCQKLTH